MIENLEESAGRTARQSLIATVVAVAVVAAALALWKLKLVVALVFLAMIIAAAMRPGVEALRRRGVPRGIGVAAHYLAVAGVVALFLWFALPRALTQVEAALGSAPTSQAQLKQAAKHSSGIKHAILAHAEARMVAFKSSSRASMPVCTTQPSVAAPN